MKGDHDSSKKCNFEAAIPMLNASSLPSAAAGDSLPAYDYRPSQKLKLRDPLVFLARSSFWRWSPEFSSPLLESQYWQCAFPQLRLRFRSGVAYSITFAVIWLLYFVSLYPLQAIVYYVLSIVVVLALLIGVFALTYYDKIYVRFYVAISVFCLLVVCVTACTMFLIRTPLITAFGIFALSIEVVLFVYTVIPLPLYLCVLFALVFSVTYECAGVFAATVAYFPGMRLGAHLMAHVLGVHIFILSEVRNRKTFLKSGQSLLVRHDLEIEKQFKDRMIQSVMPRLMAEELIKESNELTKNNRSSLFRPFNMNRMSDVSILFADIAGFTRMSTNKSAEQLVDLLSDLFGRFDALCGANGCEKISTLGDCYYCVAGCPEPRDDHAKCCVQMGLAMISAIKQFDRDRGEDVNMRVGIHTGTVLCGIVGTKRFKFDVFSNDVTLANRMESTGLPGRVHVSEVTAKFLDDQYLMEEGKPCENMKTYFIIGSKKDFRVSFKESQGSKSTGNFQSLLAELRHIDSSDVDTVSGSTGFKFGESMQNLNDPKFVKLSAFTTPLNRQDLKPGIDPAEGLNSEWHLTKQTKCEEKRQRIGIRTADNLAPDVEKNDDDQQSAFLKSASVPVYPLCRHDEGNASDAVPVGECKEMNHVLSTHSASMTRFDADHMDFDYRLAETIRGSSLAEGEYLVHRKPLNPWTLKFVDREIEKEYINHFTRKPTPSAVAGNGGGGVGGASGTVPKDKWFVEAPKFSVAVDVLVATVIYCIVMVLAMIMFGIRNAAAAVYFAVSFAFLSLFIAYMVWYLVNRNMLPPALMLWVPKHVAGLLLIDLPLGAVYCQLYRSGYAGHFSEPYIIHICALLLMVMIGHANFSQMRSWVKALSLLLLSVSAILLIHLCKFEGIIRPWPPSNPTMVVPAAVLAGMWNASETTTPTTTFSFGTSTKTMWVTTTMASPSSTSPGLGFVLSRGYQLPHGANYFYEIYVDVFLACLLIIFLNYQFEASFRMSFYGDVQACQAIQRIKEMRDQADWLLCNIIPDHVVEKLTRTLKYSENHDKVAVLFASVVNWDEVYDETYEGGREFLRMLNELISDFDEILDRPEFTQVEKIKTIGTTYMAASGLNPDRRRLSELPDSHLYELMEFALALQKTLENFNNNLLNFELVMKIGYNIGPVTSGVIGTTKLYYDIWGDTVNIASRMYSTGVVGRIQVSRHAKEMLENVYEFEFRDHIRVKGIDSGMDVYLFKVRRQEMTPRSKTFFNNF